MLKETNENETNTMWELISFHAIPVEIDKLPMGPVTMMRNQLQLEGKNIMDAASFINGYKNILINESKFKRR